MNKNIRTAFYVLVVLVVLLFLPALFVYQLSPRQFWLMGILSIGFPYLFVALLLFFVTAIFISRKIAAFLLLLLLLAIPVMRNVIRPQRPTIFVQNRQPSVIRIMQWNCQGLPGIVDGWHVGKAERKLAFDFINQYQPDIICIQDFGNTTGKGLRSNIELLTDSLRYPHHIFNRHFFGPRDWGDTWTGIAIFSRLPIVQSGTINYPGKKFPETILWLDVKVGSKTVRVATTHFQSMYLHSTALSEPLDSCFWEDSLAILHGSFVEKLKHFQPYHVRQAETLGAFIDTSALPLVLTGDLNSVPSSFVYKKVKGDLTDAYLEKNTGPGRTYHSWQPALRIDYIFHNAAIRNLQTGLFKRQFSDHDPLLMDFEIK
jgi:endonuclease/exonuclease/phosphatase family metal-dependent hydrolase